MTNMKIPKHPLEQIRLVNMIMVEDGDQVLVERRVKKDWPGIIFPGGHVEVGESLTQAAIREVKEETGLTVSKLRLVGDVHYQEEGNGEELHRHIILLYRTNTFTGEIKSGAEGEIFWLPKKDLAKQDLSSGMLDYLKIFENEELSELTYRKNPDDFTKNDTVFY